MTEFKTTEVGLIPLNWDVVKITDFAQTKSGGTPSTSKQEYWDGDVPWINSGALNNCTIKMPTKYITKCGLENSAAKLFPKNAVVIALTGATTGKVGLLDFECSTNQSVVGILPNESFNSAFLFYALINSRQRVLSFKSGAAQPHINKGVIDNFFVVFPPIPEQQNIAHILAKIQSAIETQEKIIQTTTELKKALMRKLFTEGLHGEAQKETGIGKVPKSWDVVNVGDVSLNAQYGLSLRGNSKGRYPILRMANQENGRITTDNLQFVDIDNNLFSKFKLKQGDIIFNRTNSIDLVGKTSIFDIEGDYIFASYLIRLQLNNNKIIPYFFNYYFNMPSVQNRLKTIATRGVSQSNISATRLKTFIMPLPPLIEQQEVVKMLKSFDEKLKFAKQKHGLYQALFHSMLNHLMTGQIRMMDLRLF